MKKFIIILVAAFAIFTSCKKSNKVIRIGFLNRSIEIERCKLEESFMKDRAMQLNCEFISKNAKDDDKLQIDQADELLNEGLEVLIIFPVNIYTAASIVRKAKEKGVKTIAYESLIQNCELDYFISGDNKKGGELMVDYITKLVPKGNYVIIGGDKSDKNAVLIKEGNYNILSPYIKNKDINILYDVYLDWTSESAYMETKQIIDLSATVPDAFISSNDGMASGIIKALKEFGLEGKVPVTGLDADLEACQRIVNGTQTMTIFKSLKKQAYSAIELALDNNKEKAPAMINSYLNNGKIEVPSYLIAPAIVDKNNMMDVIVKNNVYTNDDVYRITENVTK